MVFCKLPVGPSRSQLPENCGRESFGNCLHTSLRRPPGLANIKGKPTKRIIRTLTTESSGGNRFTYEKELLNSRKNSNFYKTNHPGKGNNGGLGGLMEDPISIQITTFFAYMPIWTSLIVLPFALCHSFDICLSFELCNLALFRFWALIFSRI